IDLSYRAQKAGYKLVFEPNSQVEHFHSQGSILTHFSQQEIKQIAYRNQFIFVWKNITDSRYLLNHLIWLPYHLLAALFSGDIAFWKGFVSASFLLQQIIWQRHLHRHLFKRSDLEVLAPYRDEPITK
ncbi:MAG: hypothetical protein AAB874_07975, partial [Patescibacteria group bacterium]